MLSPRSKVPNVDVTGKAHLFQRQDRGIGRIRPQRQDCIGVGIGVEIGHHPGILDLGRVLSAVDHLVAQIDPETVGESPGSVRSREGLEM